MKPKGNGIGTCFEYVSSQTKPYVRPRWLSRLFAGVVCACLLLDTLGRGGCCPLFVVEGGDTWLLVHMLATTSYIGSYHVTFPAPKNGLVVTLCGEYASTSKTPLVEIEHKKTRLNWSQWSVGKHAFLEKESNRKILSCLMIWYRHKKNRRGVLVLQNLVIVSTCLSSGVERVLLTRFCLPSSSFFLLLYQCGTLLYYPRDVPYWILLVNICGGGVYPGNGPVHCCIQIQRWNRCDNNKQPKFQVFLYMIIYYGSHMPSKHTPQAVIMQNREWMSISDYAGPLPCRLPRHEWKVSMLMGEYWLCFFVQLGPPSLFRLLSLFHTHSLFLFSNLCLFFRCLWFYVVPRPSLSWSAQWGHSFPHSSLCTEQWDDICCWTTASQQRPENWKWSVCLFMLTLSNQNRVWLNRHYFEPRTLCLSSCLFTFPICRVLLPYQTKKNYHSLPLQRLLKTKTKKANLDVK